MMIHDITALAGRYKAKKRVGRGLGSGTGKTSARGHKGQKSRSGYSQKRAHEGGQMPYFRRIRKVGFSNFKFTTRFWIVNLRDIMDHPMFAKGGTVDAAAMVKAGLIRDDSRDLKILGDIGDRKLGVKLQISAARVSDSARKLVTDAGAASFSVTAQRPRQTGAEPSTGRTSTATGPDFRGVSGLMECRSDGYISETRLRSTITKGTGKIARMSNYPRQIKAAPT